MSAAAFSKEQMLPQRIGPIPAAASDPAALLEQLKLHKRALVQSYARASDVRGALAVSSTLLPMGALWYAAAWIGSAHGAVALLLALPMSLLLLRCFALLHDCGHGSLFRTARLNRAFGFVFGVISGMPQYVWSQHHHYHHCTNGNWSRYRGPLAILSVQEFDALTPRQQRAYVRSRHPALAPLAGLMYLIGQPRLNWLRGTRDLLAHLRREKVAQPDVALRTLAAQFRTRRWKTAAEYRHMTLNNLVLLALWVLMSLWLGAALFFGLYLLGTALAGAAGLVLFTVQHNFEPSYAGDDHEWDYDEAALYGSSFLVLPGWLNWCTANIGYHHVHHLSARIPSYRLPACHAEHAALFAGVHRLRLRDILPSLDYLLWDADGRRLMTVAAHRAARERAA
ncbi:fatty acid desaturase family protein [Panacagrimonas sp.]|uniref:fatty acid desaturase family protein n=1 Tax=Panacagrimonas sp. TaxID=2480088 RepID=UPI003B525FC5